MINIIKDTNGKKIKEPEERFIIELVDGSMVEVANFKEATASVAGSEYLDCETAETEWHIRLDVAKRIGLIIITNEDNDKTIVYDERIGKIPYSYTDPNPDYKIPNDPELIRIECDETFILSLAKMRYLKVWEKVQDDYIDYLKIKNVDQEIGAYLETFRDKVQSIPLHHRI